MKCWNICNIYNVLKFIPFTYKSLLSTYVKQRYFWTRVQNREFSSISPFLFVFMTKYCRAVLAGSHSAESALTEASLFLETDRGYRLLKKCELGALVHRNEQKNLKAFLLLFCPINSACLCSAYIQINPKLQRVFTKLQSRQFMHHYYTILKINLLFQGENIL